MKIKIILPIIILSLLAGYGYGTSIDSNQYPFIIQPTPPFDVSAGTTDRGDKVTGASLATVATDGDSEGYLYVRSSVSCSDINIYALNENQTVDDVKPIATIAGQDVPCDQEGSYIDTEVNFKSNQHIELVSDKPFTYAAYQAYSGGDDNE